MRAMILAAGRGERLRPLTETTPKPLVEAGGKPLIVRHLERLAAAGFRDVIVNVSHLAQKIIDHLGDGASFGVRIRYSREAEPLETAGGIAYARELLGPSPFLLLNADIYCDYPFARLAAHELGAQLAHLVLVPNPEHRKQGDFSLVGSMVGTLSRPRHTYSGVAVVAPDLTAGVTRGSRAALGPLLVAAATASALSGELYQGLWSDVGTAVRLADLEAQLARRGGAP